MQIILISSRTLGASELLLLLSLFSHLFFSLLFVFVLLLLLFLKSFSISPLSPPPLHCCHSSLSSLLPSGLVVGLRVLSSPRRRPGLTLCGCPIQRRVTGRFGRSWWVGVGDLWFWCHFLASQIGLSQSQALSVMSGVLKNKQKSLTAGSGNAMDLMCCIWITLQSIASSPRRNFI